jgi:hypothetical protein
MTEHFTVNSKARIHLLDSAPQALKDALYRCHYDGDILPDDWIYSTAHSVAECIDDGYDIETVAQDLTDVYNDSLHRWAATTIGQYSIDDMLIDYGAVEVSSTTGIDKLFMVAQHYAIERIARILQEVA